MTERLLVYSIIAISMAGAAAHADNISPKLDQSDANYSMDQPNRQFYGNGIASRATEAMELRLEAERDLQGGRVHDAVRKAKKAAQFDPNVADSHLVLARALTACVKAEGFRDKQMYAQCIKEWRLLRWHDANSANQTEAGQQLTKLRVAKALSKVHRTEPLSVNM